MKELSNESKINKIVHKVNDHIDSIDIVELVIETMAPERRRALLASAVSSSAAESIGPEKPLHAGSITRISKRRTIGSEFSFIVL